MAVLLCGRSFLFIRRTIVDMEEYNGIWRVGKNGVILGLFLKISHSDVKPFVPTSPDRPGTRGTINLTKKNEQTIYDA